MILRRRWPEPPLESDLLTGPGQQLLSSWYEPLSPSNVRVNLVASRSGDTTGHDGTSSSLSSPADRIVLKAIRSHADAVVVGATTVRRETVPVPSGSPLVVLSRSGDLGGFRITHRVGEPSTVVVVTSATQPPRERDSALDLTWLTLSERDLDDPALLLSVFRDQGWNSLLLEGGPTTIVPFAAAGLIDELCLTTPQHLIETPSQVFSWWPETDRDWTSLQRLEGEDSVWFHRLSAR